MTTAAGSRATLEYVPALDGIRAVAILAVLGFHADKIIPGGSQGVDVFFVLSGYLITTLLRTEYAAKGKIDIRAFMKRRMRRLFPALVAFLLFHLIFTPILFTKYAQGHWVDALWAVTYAMNIRQTFWPMDSVVNHTWSLAIEGQFYLIWPFVMLRLFRLPREKAVTILWVLWAVLTVGRFVWAGSIGGAGTYYFTPLHATGLVLGSIPALVRLKLPFGKIALGLLLCFFLIRSDGSRFVFTQPFVEILTAVLILDPSRVLTLAPLPFVGRVSYGVYLWHIPVLLLVAPASPTGLAIYLGGSLLGGWLSFRFIESRFNRSLRSAHPAVSGRRSLWQRGRGRR